MAAEGSEGAGAQRGEGGRTGFVSCKTTWVDSAMVRSPVRVASCIAAVDGLESCSVEGSTEVSEE